MRQFSEDRKRMLDDDPPLVACAAYEFVDSEVIGIGTMHINYGHVGIFDNLEDAESWLETGEPKPTRISVRQA